MPRLRPSIDPANHAAGPSGIGSPWARWLTGSLLLVVVTGCGRRIEEEPPIPEHRYESCETWCALMFDPVCPAQEVRVPTEQECVELCLMEDGVWAPDGEGHDECAATHIPYVECLASLPCQELQQHFALTNMVPPEELSSCGLIERAQLDCQSAHY